jgi:uncharacterized protein YcbK (DUF882 family)
MGDISPYFDRSEFACHCGCGFDTVDADTLYALELIREHFDAPMTINSGCRCPSHNDAIGGSTGSYHMQARAADIVVEGVSPDEVADFAEQGPLKDRGGVGRYDTFTHCDTRTNGPARWTG